jgi:phosphatidate cytidylyltransferase
VAELVSRVVVAIVALPLVLGLVYVGGWWLFALGGVAAVLAVHEFAALVRQLRPLVLAAYLGAIAMLVAAAYDRIDWLLGAVLGTLGLVFVLQGLGGSRQSATAAMGATFLGATWIGLGVAHILLLRDLPDDGRLAVFTVLLAVLAADTFAYFVGRLVGRHKLAPRVSPGKTWEGFLAGTAAAILVSFFALYDQGFMGGWRSVVLGLAVALAAALGDLFESMLKRDMEVKDSGRLLGAHGGVLDRIDAHLFAAPAAFYVILALA